MRFSLLFLALNLLPLITSAQRVYPGYIITAAGDSLAGGVYVNREWELQQRVEFIPLRSHQKAVFKPIHLRAFGYTNDKATVRYEYTVLRVNHVRARFARTSGWLLSAPVPVDLPYMLQVALDGPVRLYRYSHARGFAWLLDKGRRGNLVNPGSWSFRREAPRYFAEAPALATELQQGKYRLRHLATVVQRYNEAVR